MDALLEAWRANRHGRIADLIDFASADAIQARPPIDGKTISARTTAWLEVARTRDPIELGRLVATPWPRQAKLATAVLAELLAWPDDPRLAAALAAFVEDNPLKGKAAIAAERDAYERIVALRDRRILAWLAERIAYVYKPSAALIAAHAAIEAIVEPAIVATELEAPYAARIARRRALAGEEARLLAAIHADPDDRGAYVVYGDLLAQRGDPRGEFIALQLAREVGALSPAAEVRESALIERYSDRWTGSLARSFAGNERRFERGFFAGGLVIANDAAVFADPAWRLVRVLGTAATTTQTFVADSLAHPALGRVRAIGPINVACAEQIGAGPTIANIEETCIFIYTGDTPPTTTLASLPALRTFGLWCGLVAIADAWLASSPIVERVEHLAVPAVTRAIIGTVAARAGALRTLELGPGSFGTSTCGFDVELERARAPGPFDTLALRYLARGTGGDWFATLGQILGHVRPDTIRAIRLVVPQRTPLSADQTAQVDAILARFTDATIDRASPP